MNGLKAVLVTGASGFVGRALVGVLANSSFERVVAAVRKPSSEFSFGVQQASGLDIEHADRWSEALSGVSVVVHCAARVHVMTESEQDPLQAFRRVNVEGTLRLAKLAAKQGVKRFVFLSSIKVNGESTDGGAPFSDTDIPAPEDPYGISKREAEEQLTELCARGSMELVVVRSPLVYGPGVKGNFEALIRLADTPWPLPFGALVNRRSMVYLDNLVDGIKSLCTEPKAAGKTFLISDDEDLPFRDLVLEMRRLRGRNARLLPVPLMLLHALGKISGKDEVVRRLTGSLLVDSSRLRNTLNWQAPYTVQEGLARTLAE